MLGDVPKWLKGPHSKCGRSGNRREGSNPSNSVTKSPRARRENGFNLRSAPVGAEPSLRSTSVVAGHSSPGRVATPGPRAPLQLRYE